MLRDFLDFNDLTVEEWEHIFNLAGDIYDNPDKYTERCKNKILATLFYEPSTRTQLSFQSAMQRLGGGVIGFSGTAGSSVEKGESLKDTMKMVSHYADVIAIRHPRDGSAFAASLYSDVPVINAGDGSHLHPTQTLLDLFTIGRYKKFTGLNIGVCGDLLHGRTVHSLLRAFSLYSGNTFYLISSPDFKMPVKYLENLKTDNEIFVHEKIADCLSELDIIYMTRLQKERISSWAEAIFDKSTGKILVLDKAKLANAKKDLLIMHPLPRNQEISVDVDDDERAVYFKQAGFGLYIRMALLIILLENKIPQAVQAKSKSNGKCENQNCIINDRNDTSHMPQLIKSDGSCAYCGQYSIV